MQEWITTLQKEGGAGGMKCQLVDWETHNKKYKKDCDEAGRLPTTEDAGSRAKEAAEDHQGVVKTLRRMKKRRACPEWALPAELWLQLLRPNWRSRSDISGLGTTAHIKNPNFQSCWKEVMRLIRDTGHTPMDWNRSRAFPLEKGQGKEGTESKRLIHISCAIGSVWQHTSLHRGRNEQPSWAHGCIKGRNTEGAIMVNLASAWRLRQCRRGSVTTNYDCSNAFGSVAWPHLLEGVRELAAPADEEYHNEQIAQQHFL